MPYPDQGPWGPDPRYQGPYRPEPYGRPPQPPQPPQPPPGPRGAAPPIASLLVLRLMLRSELPPGYDAISTVLSGELLALLCVQEQGQHSVRPVGFTDARNWGSDPRVLWTQGMENLRRDRIEVQRLGTAPGVTLHVVMGGSGTASAQLLRLAELLPEQAPYGALVAVPVHGVLCFLVPRAREDLAAVASMMSTGTALTRSHTPLSRRLYWWTETTFEDLDAVVEAEDDVRITVPPRLERMLGGPAEGTTESKPAPSPAGDDVGTPRWAGPPRTLTLVAPGGGSAIERAELFDGGFEALRPRLFTYVERADRLPRPESVVYYRLSDELVAPVVVRGAEALHTVERSEPGRWGVSPDRLWAYALDGLRADTYQVAEYPTHYDGVMFMVRGGTWLGAAQLLRLAELLPAPAPFGALVCVAEANTLIFMVLRTQAQLGLVGNMMRAGADLDREERPALSTTAYWWHGGALEDLLATAPSAPQEPVRLGIVSPAFHRMRATMPAR